MNHHAQEKELRKAEAARERERRAEEKKKEKERQKREKELAKAQAQQEKALTRVRQHNPASGPPDDEELEMEKLVEVSLRGGMASVTSLGNIVQGQGCCCILVALLC